MKNKLLYLAAPLMLFIGTTIISAQTVIEVAVGDTNAIKTAFSGANAGDIIELTTDGGVYWFNTNITIDKDITIRGKETLVNKPVLKYRTSSSSKYFIKGTDSPRIVLKNLEFDGDATDEAGTDKVAYITRLENGDTTETMSLFIDDIVAHDFRDKFIKPYASTGMDSLVVTNSIFFNNEKEGIVLYSGTSSDPAAKINYAEVSGCTFYSIDSEAIKGQTYDKMKVLIDRNTFYDIGAADKKPVLYFRQMTDVVVQNSIFSKNHNADTGEEFADFTSSDCIFRNNAVHDVYNADVDEATVTDTVHVDPGFADPVNGDFTLPIGSSLLDVATDGGAIGDPRWVPATGLFRVAEGEATIKDAYDVAKDGDIIELVTSGGIYTYGASDKIEITKKITIRAQEGLAKKPILRQTKPGSSSRRHFDVLAGGELTLVGLFLDGNSGVDGDANIAKDAVRLNPGDSTTVSLWVDDCDFVDFSEPFIKGYGKAVVDSFIVKNSTFANGGREGIMLYENSSNGGPAVHYAEISDITMYNVTREGIKVEKGTDPDGKILVNHATFYDIGHGEGVVGSGKSVLRFRDIDDVTVQNSIIEKNHTMDESPDKFADFAGSASVLKNTVVWDVNNFETNATVTDTLNVDPEFMDPDNGNFLLPEGSALLTFATDGKAAGDTRWDPDNFAGYILTVDVVGSGSVAKSPSAVSYFPGTNVTLTATADESWKFTGWSDNIVVFPMDNPVSTVTMNDDVDVTAYFAPDAQEYDVNITSVGYGHVKDTTYSVYGDIGGFYAGDSIVMEAVVDSANWEFAYWTNAAGDSVTDDATLSYVVDADTTFNALFRSTLDQVTFTLTVVGEDGGDLEVSPLPVPGFTTYDINTSVTIIADPIIGWEFDGYSGDVTETGDTLVVVLSGDKAVTATFAEITHADGILAIDDSWELQDALDYARNNSQVDTIKLISVGPYVPDLDDRNSSGQLDYLEVESPVSIVGDPTLASKPVIKGYTSSTGSGSSSGFFRFRKGAGKLTLRHLIIDGYHDKATDTNPAKYIFRPDDGSDTVFCSVDAKDVEMYNCYEAFWKNYGLSYVDTIRLENCYIGNVGKEGLYLKAVGNVNHIEIRNTTFKHVARQLIYLISMEPSVIVDHVTVDSCGLGYGSEGAKFPSFRIENTDYVTISNSIISNVPFDETTSTPYALRISGEHSSVHNVLFHNTPTYFSLKDGATAGPDNFWYDPMFVGPDSGNYTLADSSVAYHLADDGTAAVGDLKWATSTDPADYFGFELAVDDNGIVTIDPAPMAKFYLPNTVVTLTADADTLYKFGGWSGDATGTNESTTVTMDADKSVSASFLKAYFAVLMNVNLSFWTTEGMFDPATDTVVVKRGAVLTELDDADGDSVYSSTLKIDENVPAFEWVFGILSSTNAHEETVTRSYTAVSDDTLSFWYNYDDPALGIAGDLQPLTYELSQNYPNPFNPSTTINFALVDPGMTIMKVYDIRGREVATLVNREMEAGHHSITFHIPNLASGMYIYRLESGNFRAVKKMIMMK